MAPDTWREHTESEDKQSDEKEQDEEAIERGTWSVFNMKFMRDAAARQSREADAQAEEFQREMGFGINREEDDGDGTDTSWVLHQ